MRPAVPLIATLVLLSLIAGADDATDPRELAKMAVGAYREGRFHDCAHLYAEAIGQGARSAAIAYSAACCFALSNDLDQAFEFLDLSLERGWHDARHLEADTDLEPLHGDDRWPSIVELATAARAAYEKTNNLELLEMYEADQGDRMGQIDWSVVTPRDEQRRKRVKEILETGDVETADDYFHAAMVLQHGVEPEDYELAHELALKAAELAPEHSSALWLAAAAMDRYLQNIGKPQIYGTQFRKVDGEWTLEPIDETAVTDEERARWGVPPLASAKERVKALNARDGSQKGPRTHRPGESME